MRLRTTLAISTILLAGACSKKTDDAPKLPAPSAVTPSADASAEASCAPGPNVDFRGNTVLEAELKHERGGDGPVLLGDLPKISNVNLIAMQTDSLDPCIFPLLTGARNLFLGRGALKDLAPIAGLTHLSSVQIAFDDVSDVSALAAMTQMDRLDLEQTMVHDLTPLAKMTQLTQLQLDQTPVEDLSPLAVCTNLEKLSIRNTKVSDLSPLKDSKKLRALYIEGAPVKDTAVLGPLVKAGLKIVRKGRL